MAKKTYNNHEKASAILEMLEVRLASGAAVTHDVLWDYSEEQLALVVEILDLVFDFNDDGDKEDCCQKCNKMCHNEKCSVDNFVKYFGVKETGKHR